MGKIVTLSAEVQGQIAAGEVIERPASVVKELMENALDAGAGHLEVQLAAGGLDRIAVIDDGEGMDAADAVQAFGRHATSKLRSADELAAVQTLGFRGEALASLAAAARVRIVTRTASAPNAVLVEADLHGVHLRGPASRAGGTTVEVLDLFGTTPARRKFLRTPGTELGHVVDVITRLAIANPTVGVRLVADDRELMSHPPVRDVTQRLTQVLGSTRAGGFVPFASELGGARVQGLLGPPRESVASPRLLWTYVGVRRARAEEGGAVRWVRDRVLTRAVLDGYQSFVSKGRYPAAVVVVHLPPGSMDVNVHPAKLEVRFQRSATVHQLVSGAIGARLREALGAPAPSGAEQEDAGVLPSADSTDAGGGPLAALGDSVAEQQSLWQPAARGFRALRFVGQVFDGYLLCERDGDVLLIDQHAAHERVLYERLQLEHARRGIETETLLVPETIAVSVSECATLAEHAEALREIGLEGEPFGPETYLVRVVPTLLRDRGLGEVVRALATELDGVGTVTVARRAVDRVLATIACHSAVRVGQRLAPAHVDALLASMDDAAVNAHCPHGRPVAAILRRSAVEALFHR